MRAKEVAMRKSIPVEKQAGFISIADLPRISKSYRETTFVASRLGGVG